MKKATELNAARATAGTLAEAPVRTEMVARKRKSSRGKSKTSSFPKKRRVVMETTAVSHEHDHDINTSALTTERDEEPPRNDGILGTSDRRDNDTCLPESDAHSQPISEPVSVSPLSAVQSQKPKV